MKNIKFKKFLSYKNLYWLYIFLIGLVFIFFVPPFQKADEHTHYERAQSLANGQFYCSSLKGFVLNNGEHNLVREMFFFEITQKYNEKFPKSVISLKKNNEVGEIEQGRSACSLNFFGYIPSSIGLLIGKPFDYPLLSFYFARVCSFLFFLYCFIFSLKILKNSSYKYILYFYGIIPIILHQVTSISYDVVHLSLLPLVFSLYIRLNEKNTYYKKYLYWFLVLLVLIILGKTGYYSLFILYFFIPKKNIAKTNLKYLQITFIFLLVYFLSIYFGHFLLTNNTTANTFIDPDIVNLTNMDLLKVRPILFFKILYDTTILMAPFYFESAIGVFAFLDYKLPYFIFYIYFLLFFYTCHKISELIDKKDESFSNIKCMFLISLIISTYFIIQLAIYLSWNVPGAAIIKGLQGRYLIFSIPFIMLCFANLYNNLKNNKAAKFFVLFCFFTIIFGSIYTSIYNRYYDYRQTFTNTEEIENKYNELILNNYKIDKIKIDSKKNFLINVDKNRKIGGFEMFYISNNKKIDTLYEYRLKDNDCNKELFRGYLDQSLIQKDGLYKVIFNKIIELKYNAVCLEIEPIGNLPDQNYIDILSSDSNLMLNVLYIRN